MVHTGERSEIAHPPTAKPFRPREIWAGTLLMVVAIFVGAAAMISTDVVLGVVAAVAFAVGGAVALHGRIMRDTHGASAIRREWTDVKDGKSNRPVGLNPRDKGKLGHG